MPDRKAVATFLYHLGKGLWKSVPVLGPLVEEMVYEQFRDKLTAHVDRLSDEDLQRIADAVPDIDLDGLDNSLANMSEEIKAITMAQFGRVLQDMHGQHEELQRGVDRANRQLSELPSMLTILQNLQERAGDRASLEEALEDYSRRREQWVNRLSGNQRRVLCNVSDDYTPLASLWQITLRVIPDCGYKEFRFRLHELEWLGLVERYWHEGETWRYRRTATGRKQANAW